MNDPSIGIIGGSDGPTAIFVSGSIAPLIIVPIVMIATVVAIVIIVKKKKKKK